MLFRESGHRLDVVTAALSPKQCQRRFYGEWFSAASMQSTKVIGEGAQRKLLPSGPSSLPGALRTRHFVLYIWLVPGHRATGALASIRHGLKT